MTLAAYEGQLAVVRNLADRNANLEAKDGKTLVALAALADHRE